MAEPRASRPVSIEDVVAALSGQCDGAKARDGRGFSRADANEGGRLSALKRNGIAWTAADARKAAEIVARYSVQGSVLLGRGVEAREKGIAAAIKGNRLGVRDEISEDQAPYNWCCLSPGGKQAQFWRLARVDDLSALASALRSASRLSHGARRAWMRDDRADLTVNGTRRRAARILVDFNGTTRPLVLDTARAHGFLVDPAVEAEPDAEIDALRRHPRAAWLFSGVRDGRKGTWAVFDLDRRHDPFSESVKTTLRGRFACLEHDDWNWYVEFDAATLLPVARILRDHGFAVSAALRRTVMEAVSARRAAAG